ncbi:protein GAMETE EXPRESSED 1 [Malania oleifera]|uniref:protein GAMETE EXPRESSED 1 n=1 Tax=Malania oleifera TaxID=397392 RepID=UPI0025AEA277|nr:protein GAMETE EXPRESSED 1 [Malania oleifera]
MGRLFLSFLLLFFQNCQSWSWFQSSTETRFAENPSGANDMFKGSVAEFSMEGLTDRKGIKLVENARQKLVASNSCWQNAYRNLFAGCAEVIAVEEKRSKLAWYLSDCFQKDSGRPPFPSCDTRTAMKRCLAKLDEDERRIYLEFYLETNSICHQLQTNAFKHETERLVNELKKSAEFAEDKLEKIEDRSEFLLKSSNQVHESISSIDLRTQQLAQSSKKVEDHIDVVLKHSEAVYEQSKGIATSQMELREGQVKMKEKLEEGMELLHVSYKNLGQGIDSLRNEAVQIEEEISRVSDAMSMKMENLQNRADDIGNMAGVSLDRQRELLDGQSTALQGLQSLTQFQSLALEESRGILQQMSEFGRRQQEELLRRQEQLQQAHDHLVENSKSILAAQEVFESKQESMFMALDKLFTLHNAMLAESRLIKAFFIYSLSIFLIYMFTSTKQTYTVRPWLYIGLCAAFLIECAIIRFTGNNIEQQTRVISLVRMLFVFFASGQLLHAIYTYRDYDVLNHQLLQTLIEKVNTIERNKELSWDMDVESDINWSSWIDSELPEDLSNLEDPDYTPVEEVAENSICTSRRYNLRNRRR